jgi:nucleoid-associated protein YgaU
MESAADGSAAAPGAAAEQAPGDATAEGAVVEIQPVEPAPQPEPEVRKPDPVTVQAIEVENGNRFYAAGTAEPGSTVRIYVDDKPVADTKTMETGRWLLEHDLELGPGVHSVRVDHVTPEGSVITRAEVPYEIAEELPPAPTDASGTGIVTAGGGDAGAATAQSQTLIIRRGDNLWRIAKRLYGRGVRYSTIYQANTDQIRNPNLIYPGQVFVIPEGDTTWQPVEP